MLDLTQVSWYYLFQMRYTARDFHQDFPDDEVCLDTIFKEQYGDLESCPSCGAIGTRFYKVTGRKCYACMYCGHQLYPLAGTIFHKSSTSLWKWFFAMYLFSNAKNGISAPELQRHLGVTYKTAYRMLKRIRSLTEQEGPVGGEGQIVEADETFYGGRKPGKLGWTGKTPILGVLHRGGAVRAMVSDTVSTRRIQAFFALYLRAGSELHTDESKSYYWTNKVMVHKVVNHSKHEYGRGYVTTNRIEGFWSQLKRSIDGTYHAVSREHLQMYVDEFVFRYNLRHVVMWPVLLTLAALPSSRVA